MSSPSSSVSQAAAPRHSGGLGGYLLPPLAAIMVCAGLVLGATRLQVVQASAAALESPAQVKGTGGISPLFTPQVQAWEEQILIWGERYQLDPNLVATVMQIESCGYLEAESPAGARGLFQVMPYHFQDGEDPFDPATNAKRGLSYLRQALEAGGRSKLALAGYNGGIYGASLPEEDWPDETRRYVHWGLQIFRDARNGLDHSNRLDEWLDAGGERLCAKADIVQ